MMRSPPGSLDPGASPLFASPDDVIAWVRAVDWLLEPRGLTSVPGPNRVSTPLAVPNLHRLLQHPYYIAMVRYRGHVYPGRHEPLVSEQTWSKVQAVLRAQSEAREKKRKGREETAS